MKDIMKKPYLFIGALVAGTILFAGTANRSNKPSYGFINGAPEIQSITSLAFGPNGTLFLGDSKNASVVALETKDITSIEKAEAVAMKNIDQKIAAALGTQVQNITIRDMAVNPISKKVYLAVEYSDGTPVLLTIEGDKISSVSLNNVGYSIVALNDAPAADAKDQRGNSLRISSISDIEFSDGKLMVSGLSNKEFSSSFRSIPFPFTDSQDQASLEIYHAAHSRYETASPIRTFTTTEINGKKYLIASYTCTPLVLFPLDELKAGAHVKGRTVAEMGSGNSPVDMITMKKGDESMLVMSNTNRPVFIVDFKDIEGYQDSLTTPVPKNYETAGVDFRSMNMVNVLQLDKLDDTQMVMIQRKANGDLDLLTSNERSL